MAQNYKKALIEQLKVSKANVFLGEIVEEIEKIDELFYVTTSKQTILAKTVIAATGNGFSEVKESNMRTSRKKYSMTRQLSNNMMDQLQ